MIRYLLNSQPFLILLFIVNVFGTAYGYWWYRGQLAVTPDHFLLFVPDSPTASLFFCVFLAFYIFGRNVPYVEALGVVTLFKYGIWAVVMNVLLLLENGSLAPTGYMLIVSHGAMAIQGLLYTPFYKIKMRHLVFAGIWTLHNDIIDYVFEMMPSYGSLMIYMDEIGYFTFWLSIVSIAIAYRLTVYKNLNKTYNL